VLRLHGPRNVKWGGGVRRPKLKRGRDRYRPLARLTKPKLGLKVWHKHTYHISGDEFVCWESSVIEIVHKSGLLAIRTVYGYERTVALNTLFV